MMRNGQKIRSKEEDKTIVSLISVNTEQLKTKMEITANKFVNPSHLCNM